MSPTIRRPGFTLSWRSVAVWLVLMTACAGNGGEGTPSPSTTPSPPPSTLPPDAVETPCLSANPAFLQRGTVSVLGGSGPDASLLSGLDWLITPDCERIVFGFLTADSAPASSIGLSRLEFFPEQAILRIAMPRGVQSTAIADALGALIHRAFVVRSRSGELAVELHMNRDTAIEARGLLIGSPARLVVDVRPGATDAEFGTAPPTAGPSIVVLSPSPGATGYPLRIRGYARTPDDVVTAVVTGDGPRVERRITAADSSDAWGEYAVTISEGPTGSVELVVDAEGAPDIGLSDAISKNGVTVGLTVP